MTENYELCQYYLEFDQSFCDKSNEALWKMLKDRTARSELAEIERLVFYCEDMETAVKECECLKTYANLFLGVDIDFVLAAVLMYIVPEAVKKMRNRGIREEIIEATLKDTKLWVEDYRKKTGREGIGETEWNLKVMTGRVLQLGRLQYERCLFREPYYIYRNRSTGEWKVIAEAGLSVRKDGRLQGTNGKRCEDGYTTTLRIENGMLWGNMSDTTNGVLIEEPVSICMKAYELLLAPGLPVINIHIPATGPLRAEEVKTSFGQAKQFFAEHGYPGNVGVCISWLMDVNLSEFAPESGNICQFMRRFEKFPVLSEMPSGMDRIFGANGSKLKVRDLPEKTKLQSALKSYLLRGGAIYDTGGILQFNE